MWLFPWCQMALVSGRCYLLLPECFSACFSKTIFGLAQHAFVWDYFFFSFFLWVWGKQDAEDKAVNCRAWLTRGVAQHVDLWLLVKLRKRIRSLWEDVLSSLVCNLFWFFFYFFCFFPHTSAPAMGEGVDGISFYLFLWDPPSSAMGH